MAKEESIFVGRGFFISLNRILPTIDVGQPRENAACMGEIMPCEDIMRYILEHDTVLALFHMRYKEGTILFLGLPCYIAIKFQALGGVYLLGLDISHSK